MLPAILTFAALNAPAAHAEVVRHAIIVGVNNGGGELEPLHHAEEDAKRMAEVLGEIGGFNPENVHLLLSPDAGSLRVALRTLDIDRSDTNEDLFLFYYSGHADARGLRLGEQVYTFEALKADIRAVPADVRLGILDACRSGAITRVKGADVVDPFLEESLETEGEAWITASSDDERAQESDALGGSFFTYYLVSGLRGAAAGSDSVVSLNEAYSYAYERTVARTDGTNGGAQHPEYDFKLQGRGDLELTVIDRGESWITLPSDTTGRITILRDPQNTYVAEVNKAAGQPMTIALPPGRYKLRRRDGEQVWEVVVSLSDGANHTAVRWGTSATEVAAWKGGEAPAAEPTVAELDPPEGIPAKLDEAGHVVSERSNELVDRGLGALQTSQVQIERGIDATRRYDFQDSPAVAGGFSAILPGSGQMYNQQYKKGLAMMAGTAVLLGAGFGSSDDHGGFGPLQGGPTGPNPLTLGGWMLYGWSVSDAAWTRGGQPMDRPEKGWTLSAETAWYNTVQTPYTAGLAADFVLVPGFSLGVDRTGWTSAQVGEGGTFSLGGRAMLAKDFNRFRPGVFVATGLRVGDIVLRDVGQDRNTVRLAMGGGINARYYLNPRYFVSYELRLESDGGDPRLTNAGGLGVQFGH